MADKRLIEYLKMHGLVEDAPERLETAMFAATPDKLQTALRYALTSLEELIVERDRLLIALAEAQEQNAALMRRGGEHGA